MSSVRDRVFLVGFVLEWRDMAYLREGWARGLIGSKETMYVVVVLFPSAWLQYLPYI